MTDQVANEGGARWSRWRVAGWSGAAMLLLLPFVAMRLGDEVEWSPGDFLLLGAMLALAGGAIELAARRSRHIAYRAGVAVAAAASFALVWVNLAVGFFGNEDNPANLMSLGVIAVAASGAAAARFHAAGMAKAMIATAAAQALVGVVALAAGLASAGTAGVYEAVGGSGAFAALWLLAAWLFARAAATPRAGPKRG